MKFRDLVELLLTMETDKDINDKDVVIRDVNGLDWELEPRLIFVEHDRVVIDSTGINRVEY